MKIEGIEWEEVTKQETDSLADDEFGIWTTNNEPHYFKKPQKFPIVFEDDIYRIEIWKGTMDIKYPKDNEVFVFGYNQSFPLLVKAVEKAKEIMKKNETD